MLQANQIRAARALLNWSQGDLVERSGLSLTTIRRMEDDAIGPERSSAGNVAVVTKILEDGGVLFLSSEDVVRVGAGVRVMPLLKAYQDGKAAHLKDPLKGQRTNPYTSHQELSNEFFRGFQDSADAQ